MEAKERDSENQDTIIVAYYDGREEFPRAKCSVNWLKVFIFKAIYHDYTFKDSEIRKYVDVAVKIN